MTGVTIQNAPPLWQTTLLGYLLPFIAFYLGIYIRHKLHSPLFPDDILGFKELSLVGILFSILAVAPLLPAFNHAAETSGANYLMTIAVVMQAGLFMPESLARAVARQRTAHPAGTPPAEGAGNERREDFGQTA